MVQTVDHPENKLYCLRDIIHVKQDDLVLYIYG